MANTVLEKPTGLEGIEQVSLELRDLILMLMRGEQIPSLDLLKIDTGLTDLFEGVNEELNMAEVLTLLIAIMPHLQPGFYDDIIKEGLPEGGDFPQFGGVRGTNHRGLLPTGETVQFILAGSDINKRMQVQQMLTAGTLVKENIVSLETVKEGEPMMSGRLILAKEQVDLLTTGKITPPAFSQDFPAKLIETKLELDDLILRSGTLAQIDAMKRWINHHEELERDSSIGHKVRPGFKTLFYGAPGTGKSATAALLGKQFGSPVYRIDIALVSSKYIGDSEKNLEKIFSRALNKGWILFFDEADSLFSKRSTGGGASTSNDRYSNQEINYLLQRFEEFPGLCILATNIKNNIDRAFIRRFDEIVHFPMPDASERLRIWKKNLPAEIAIESGVDFNVYADKYEFSGASIASIMQYTALCALERRGKITRNDLANAIKKELLKEDKYFE